MRNFRLIILCAIILVAVLGVSIAAAEINNPSNDTLAEIGEGDRLLAWFAEARKPETQAFNAVGDLVTINQPDDLQFVAEVLPQSTRVDLCSQNPVSPDGRHVALFMGTEGGVVANLYLVTDNGLPTVLSEGFQIYGCYGTNGTLQFSDDSERVVFINYERSSNFDFADGILNIVNIADQTTVHSQSQVVGFDQRGEDVVYTRFFTDNFNEADEAALYIWNGSSEREITAFIAEDNCHYNSANTRFGADDDIWLMLGIRCEGQGSTLNLLRINTSDNSLEEHFTIESGGVIAPYSETNKMWFSEDGNYLFFTRPDGITASTTGLYRYDIAAGIDRYSDDNPFPVIAQQMVMERATGEVLTATRTSPDGRWIAASTTNPNNTDRALTLVDLANPLAEPVRIQAWPGGDFVSYLEFAPDGQSIIMVAGGNGEENSENSLFRIDMTAEPPAAARVTRGNFTHWGAISPNGEEIAMLEYEFLGEGIIGPTFLNTVVVNLNTAEKTQLFTGGEVISEQVQNYKFVMPLYWSRP